MVMVAGAGLVPAPRSGPGVAELAGGAAEGVVARRRRPLARQTRAVPTQVPTRRSPENSRTHGNSANAADNRFVVYQDEVRYGGDQAWRNNKPGNIIGGAFANAHGACLPTESAGHQCGAVELRWGSGNEAPIRRYSRCSAAITSWSLTGLSRSNDSSIACSVALRI
jgi:hypothetical protein